MQKSSESISYNPALLSEETPKVFNLLIDEFVSNLSKYKPFPNESKPGFILDTLPQSAPEESESLDDIIHSTQKNIFHKVVSWHHPMMFGYMPANLTHGAIIGDYLTTLMNNTQHREILNDAHTELENLMVDWCAKAFSLPEKFLFSNMGGGLISNTIGEGNIMMVNTARARKVKELGITKRDPRNLKLVGYYTSHCHYSTLRALEIKEVAIIREIPEKWNEEAKQFLLDPEDVRKIVENDVAKGLIPFFYGATVGATSTGAADPVEELVKICKKYKIWLNIDAAWAGASFCCPESNELYAKGLEGVQSIGINLGKWFFTGMGVAMFWIEDKKEFMSVIGKEDYLKKAEEVGHKYYPMDPGDWSQTTGRRFNALRVWYVMRCLGMKKVRDNVRENCEVAKILEDKIQMHYRLELTCRRELCIVCFQITKDRFGNPYPEDKLNKINTIFREKIVESGEFYLCNGDAGRKNFVRFILNNPETGRDGVMKLWKHIEQVIESLD